MAFRIIRQDITQVTADVIVNSANPSPICGGSTEARIYDVAGYDELLEARREVGALEVGQLGVTPAFNLPAKNIIHISCPWWDDENPGLSREILFDCYGSVMEKALELGAKSIAFPLLSSGVYRFPKALALEVATDVFKNYERLDIEIILAVYDDDSFAHAYETYSRIEDLLCQVHEPEVHYDEFLGECCCLREYAVEKPKPKPPKKLKLEDEIAKAILAMDDDTFQDKMMGYIEKKGMDAATVYRAANLDRKLFSKLKKDGYIPSKNTVLALAVGLQLNLEETADLLSRANHAFSPSSKRDAIIKHFIQRGDTYGKGRPIDVINDYLTCFREEPLGLP